MHLFNYELKALHLREAVNESGQDTLSKKHISSDHSLCSDLFVGVYNASNVSGDGDSEVPGSSPEGQRLRQSGRRQSS